MEEYFKMTIRPFTRQKCSVFVWGARRRTSTPFLASRLAGIKYHQTTVVSFTEEGKKQNLSSIICQASTRFSSWRTYSILLEDYSELTWVCSKKLTSFIIGKWWSNSVLIKKCAPSTTVSVILSRQRDIKRRKGVQNAGRKGKGK